MPRALCTAAVAALGLAAAACTSPAPPGFSGGVGHRWSFPLVGTLENGLLITTVTVNTYGPYLFAIDPDAPMSIVDAELVKIADLRAFAGPARRDETDTLHPRTYAEVIGLEVGTLIVEHRDAMVAPRGLYDVAGRRIHGVLGRDVLTDSLVFGFDRDRGLGHLVAQRSFRPPRSTVEVPYGLVPPRVADGKGQPVPRRVLAASVNGEQLALHVDLGAVPSQLREELWERAKLVPRELRAVVVDEVATARAVAVGSEPAEVSLGSTGMPPRSGSSAQIIGRAAFIPYADRRWDARDVAGTVGLGVFADHVVWTSWDARALYVAPRRPVDPATRIARWESPVLARCKQTGCVEVRVIDPLAGKPPAEGKPHPGLVLSITREEPAGGMGLEVVLEAEPAMPYLIVNLPPHVDRLLHQLKPEWLGKPLAVVDASPHPRSCPGGGGCVDQLAR